MKNTKITDLSWPLTNHTPIYPGDPVPQITTAAVLEKEGYNLSAVAIGTQTGSHVDAPFHVLPHGATIDQIPLQYFTGEACVFPFLDKHENEAITVKDFLPYSNLLGQTSILLIRTDWYKNIGTPLFFNHPYLTAQAGEMLIKKGIRFLCMDTLNVDKTGEAVFPVHELFAQNNLLIGENWKSFDQISSLKFILSAFPLNISGTDGSPVRAVAVETC